MCFLDLHKLLDLNVVRKEIGQTSVSSKIIMKMKNTAAEKLFSSATILPDIVEGNVRW